MEKISKEKEAKVVIIISITSDIGLALAKRYSRDGYTLVGTYRSKMLLPELYVLPDCHLYYCDISDKDSIAHFIKDYSKLKLSWNVYISCPCTPLPLRAFFKSDFDEWSDSVHINAIEQLRILHQMHSFRNTKKNISDVVFFAGGGVNDSVINISAYTASKIMLIKMCEFLDAENDDLNVFIVGPGWTKTKIHKLIIENINKSDNRYDRTVKLMKHGKGTSLNDIYGCIRWLSKQGKKMVGGRNFSVVNDKWKGGDSNELAAKLMEDESMYKLRRFKNDWSTKKEKITR